MHHPSHNLCEIPLRDCHNPINWTVECGSHIRTWHDWLALKLYILLIYNIILCLIALGADTTMPRLDGYYSSQSMWTNLDARTNNSSTNAWKLRLSIQVICENNHCTTHLSEKDHQLWWQIWLWVKGQGQIEHCQSLNLCLQFQLSVKAYEPLVSCNSMPLNI